MLLFELLLQLNLLEFKRRGYKGFQERPLQYLDILEIKKIVTIKEKKN